MKDFESPQGEAKHFTLKEVYGNNLTLPADYREAVVVTLQPLETLVIEATPAK